MAFNFVVHFVSAIGLLGLFFWLKKTEDARRGLLDLINSTVRSNTNKMIKVSVGDPLALLGRCCGMLGIEYENDWQSDGKLYKVSFVQFLDLHLGYMVRSVKINGKGEVLISTDKIVDKAQEVASALSSELHLKCSIIA